MPDFREYIRSGAEFSPCRAYRYILTRRWAERGRVLGCIMLNPSTADESANDPTVERCERRARTWDYAALIVANIFAFRSTDPATLYAQDDPVGPSNLSALQVAASSSEIVICGWGEHGAYKNQGARALVALAPYASKLRALRINKSGHPAHPLYLPYDLTPIPYPREGTLL